MKKLILLIALIAPVWGMAQAEMEKKGETLALHDHVAKIDMTLYDKGGAKYVGIKLSTLLDLGCVDTSTAFLIYLDNGDEISGRVEDLNCGATVSNKGGFGTKVARHAEYELFYMLDAEDLELLRAHPMSAFDIEGTHMAIERTEDMLQEMSKKQFKDFFMTNLKL